MELSLELTGDRRIFAPGETVAGTAEWSLEGLPEALEVRLFWYTEGRGDQDVSIARTVTLEPSPQGRHEFELRLPDGPLSFSGKLISLVWALELVALPAGRAERVELVVSHTGSEIRLDRAEPSSAGDSPFQPA